MILLMKNKPLKNAMVLLHVLIKSLCLMCVSPATVMKGSSHVPPMCVMQFVGFMATVTTSHLMTRGLTSMESVNTHSYR